MKKLVLFMTMAAAVAFTSCSKDDDDNSCESCSVEESAVEMCDNGDGTYTLSIAGEDQIVEDLEGLTSKQIVDATCESLKLLQDFQ